VKSAAEHFKTIAKSDPSLVFSLGPRLSGGRDLFLQPCVRILAAGEFEDPAQGSSAAGEFEMSAVRSQLQDDCVDEDERHVKLPRRGFFFFKIVDVKPSGRPVSHNAPRITESDCMAAQPVDVVMADTARRAIEVQLQPTSAEDMTKFYMLGPSSMHSDDLQTLRLWRMPPTLSYTFGLRPESRLSDAMQLVCSGFISSFRSAGPADASYVLTQESGQYAEQLEVLHMLQRQGCVHRRHGCSEDWTLTCKGMSRLRCSALLSDSRLVCKPREGVELEDYNTFELMSQLHSDGWVACVLQPGMKTRECQSFVPGGPKRWWVRHNATSAFRPYLLALLLAAKHGWKVEHFQTKRCYECLLAGKPYAPRVCGQAFKMASVQRAGEEGPLRQPRVGARKASRAVTAATPDGGSGRGSSGGSSASGAGSDDGSGMLASKSSSSSSSSSRRSSSRASDSGCSNSSRGSGDSGGQPGGQQQQSDKSNSPSSSSSDDDGCSSSSKSSGAVEGAVPIASAVEAAEPAEPAEDVLLPPQTWWRDFQFTQVIRAGEGCTGYQVTCYILDHAHAGTARCTRTRNFRTYGGPHIVERMLKSWCLRGHDASCADHISHLQMSDLPVAELPTLQALDAMEIIAEKPLSGPALKRRRKGD